MKLWNFEEHKEKIAVITEEVNTLTYEEIFSLQKQLSQQIDKRALVCILADNELGSFVGYLSCICNDFVPILFSVETNLDQLQQFMKSYLPEYLWMSQRNWGKNSPIWREDYKEKFFFLDYILLERKEKGNTLLHEDLALLLPTSGSTGTPKLVRISKKNLLANTKSICQYLRLNYNDRAITSLPMSYTYGLSVINTHLFVGGSIVLTKAKAIQRRFWDLVKGNEVTFLSGVPYTYECMTKIGANTFTLPKLRILTQAGGKLSKEQQKYWGKYAKENKKEFYVMYGQTEATARISYLPAADCLRKIGSVGIAIPDSRIELQDERGNRIIEPWKQGEVICVGEQVSMGYAESRQELMLPDENKGILHTGDLGYKDEEGYLYITGRKNRFAKIYGKRIDLNYVEMLIEEIIGQEVVAMSDDKKIYLYCDGEITEEMQADLKRKITLSVNVFVVRKKSEIPRRDTGKIDYGRRVEG